MIAILLSPVYILFHIYIAYWLFSWMGACHKIFKRKGVRVLVLGIYSFLASCILTSFLLPASPLQRILKLISNYWLGTLLYIILTVVIADLLRRILLKLKFKYSRKIFCRRGFVIGGMVSILVIAAFTITGIWGAAHIQVTDYQVYIDKECKDLDTLQIVLIADLHLGYSIGCLHMQQMVEKINALHPDLVVIAGDIFDNEYEALDDPKRLSEILSGITSKYGVYACYGNHDIDERLLAGFTLTLGSQDKTENGSDPQMAAFLEQAGITLLQEQGVLIEDAFYLYGRPDYQKPGRGIEKRLEPSEITAQMDQTKPIIVLDHQPRQLEELAQAGVDLDLSGHTHNGQLFPGNIPIQWMWENAYGYLQKGQMHNIVTSGVGVFGPNMRVGTKSEICNIQIHFSQEDSAQG